MFNKKHKPIVLFKGDSTNFQNAQHIDVVIETDLPLNGCSAHFEFLDFSQNWKPVPEDKILKLTIPMEVTRRFPLGMNFATVYLNDAAGRRRTLTNTIPVHVTNNVDMAYNSTSPEEITCGCKYTITYDEITNKPNGVAPCPVTSGSVNVRDLNFNYGMMSVYVDQPGLTLYGSAASFWMQGDTVWHMSIDLAPDNMYLIFRSDSTNVYYVTKCGRIG